MERGAADKRGFRVAEIAGNEFAAGVWKVKDMAKREDASVPEADELAEVQATLA